MAYIGYNPSQLAIAPFATKYFTGDGTTTTFTLDQSVPGANEANVEVFVENVQQNPVDAYTIGGALNNSLIFSEAPVTGGAIYVIHKGEATYNLQPATGSVTAATLDPVLRNFTVDNFTGNGSATTFTMTDTPYSANSILVTVDGIVQTASTNYTVSGTTLSFGSSAPDSGAVITVVHLGFSSGNKAVMDASITPVKLSTGGIRWDTSYNAYVGNNATNESATGIQGNLILGGPSGRRLGFAATSDTHYVKYKSTTIDGLDINGYSGLVFSTGSTSNSTWAERVRLDINGFLGLGADPAGTINTNYITGNTNAKNLAINGNGAAASADGRLVLSNTQPYASISVGSSTAGRVFFGFPNASGGTTGNYAVIDSVAAGSGGANGYGITLRIRPKSDNGADIIAAQFLPSGTIDLPYGQIKFPAVVNASSDPNTLDDYEEGTWQPSYNGGLTGITYGSVRNGYYRKIGSQVTIWFGIMSDGLTVTTSSLNISGLPFTAIASAGSNGTLDVNNACRWVSNPPISGTVEPNTTAIVLYSSFTATGAGTDPVTVTTGNMATGNGNRNILFGTATYIAV